MKSSIISRLLLAFLLCATWPAFAAQVSALDPGTTEATSSVISCAVGGTISISTLSGGIPSDANETISRTAGNIKVGVAVLNAKTPVFSMTSLCPGDFYVYRPGGSAVGAVYDLSTGTGGAITGTVTANAGTNLNTSALATSAKQDTLAAAVATAAKQDTLAALVATAAKQDSIIAALGTPAQQTGATFQPITGTTGGATKYHVVGGLTNAATAVKASAGQLYGWYITNANATDCYVQWYDLAAASVTVGTTVADLSFAIKANGGSAVMSATGINFANAFSVAGTTTESGSTACSVNLSFNAFIK